MAPPTKKNLAPKNREKYSLSKCVYDFYSYLQPFGRAHLGMESIPLALPASSAFLEFAQELSKLKKHHHPLITTDCNL